MTARPLGTWNLVPLASIAEVRLGKMLDRSRNRTGTKRTYLRNVNVRWGRIDTSDLAEMYFDEDEIERFELRPGDVLVCEGGEPGRAAVWDGSTPEMMYQKALHRVRFKVEYEPALFVCLMELFVRSGQLERSFTGSTIRHFTRESFSQLLVPLIPPTEQRQLLSDLEAALSRLEFAIAALKRSRANLTRYKASIHKAACEGTLVPTEAHLAQLERRPYESGKSLATRTPIPPRPNRWNSRTKDTIVGHSALAVGNPGSVLPEGWAWVQLADIAVMSTGHTPSRRHGEWWSGDVPWVSLGDAREADGSTIQDTLEHTNADGLKNSAATLLPEGTVCVSRTASVGYVLVLGRPMSTSQDFVNWTPTEAVESTWLRIVFGADRNAIRRFGKGSVHNTVYFSEWLAVHIALPPLAEQRRISQEFDRSLSLAIALERSILADLARSSRLRSALLYAGLGRVLGPEPPDFKLEPYEHPLLTRRERRTPTMIRPYYDSTALVPADLQARLNDVGGSMMPADLLFVTRLEDDVDTFFDLLREGARNSLFSVPVGQNQPITTTSDEN